MLIDTATKGMVNYYVPDREELENITRLFDALSDPTRIKMISALAISEMCVGDMAEILRINQTTVSHQLKYLKDVGFVKSRRCGKIVLYSVGSSYLYDMLLAGVKQVGMVN